MANIFATDYEEQHFKAVIKGLNAQFEADSFEQLIEDLLLRREQGCSLANMGAWLNSLGLKTYPFINGILAKLYHEEGAYEFARLCALAVQRDFPDEIYWSDLVK